MNPEVRVGDVRGFADEEAWIVLVVDRDSAGKGWRCLTLVDGQHPKFEGLMDEQWDDHVCRGMPLIQRTLGEEGSPSESAIVRE